MTMPIIKKNGFSLVETIIAAVIFTLAVAGFYAGINALSRPADVQTEDTTAAFIAKAILDELRNSVSAEDWDSGDLAIQSNTVLPDVVVGTRTFHPVYTVIDDPDGSGARKVTITVTWTD